jgi:predicted AlkP superfamily pyrophosphatase or phosphodiesterase
MRQLLLISLLLLTVINAIPFFKKTSLDPYKTRVILIGIDGLYLRCLNEYKHKTIQNFVDNGSYTFRARTAFRAISGPAWTGILCGMDQEGSGVQNNTWSAPWINSNYKPEVTAESGGDSPLPCIFQEIKKANPKSKIKAFFSWWWLANLSNSSIPNSIDNEITCNMDGTGSYALCDEQAIKAGKDWISEDFDFMFLYLGSLDEKGHAYRFCSPEYMDQLKRLDDLTLELLSHLEQENILNSTHIIITSDHGANYLDIYHGYQNDDNLNIPWLIMGPDVKKGYQIKSNNIRYYDTTSTIMRIFGYEPNPYWRSKVVEEVFNYTQKNQNEKANALAADAEYLGRYNIASILFAYIFIFLF